MLDKNKFMGTVVAAGLNQRKLAKLMKMSKNTINSRVNGRSQFDTEEIDRLCEILGIDDDNEKAKIFLAQSSQIRDDIKAS